MICAIHQPNFLCWLPYFLKIKHADVFVILGEAQFSRDYYQHRFNIGDKMYTMPVVHGNIPIKDKLYKDSAAGWAKIKRQLPQYENILSVFDSYISDSLLKTNTGIIYKICELLGIDTAKIHNDYPTELTSNERLIDICKHFGCNEYLSGNGAKEYVDEKLFADAGIMLTYQTIKPEHKIPIVEWLCRLGY